MSACVYSLVDGSRTINHWEPPDEFMPEKEVALNKYRSQRPPHVQAGSSLFEVQRIQLGPEIIEDLLSVGFALKECRFRISTFQDDFIPRLVVANTYL